MKLALLIGNRFNPWHFRGYERLTGFPEVTVFRAESEIQERFDQRSDETFAFRFERMYYDTQTGNPLTRMANVFAERYLRREPRILYFHERLGGFDVVQTWELFTDWSLEAVAAKERFGPKLVVMVWDNIPFNMEQSEERKAIKKRVIAAADRFVVHSERSARMLDIEGAPKDRIVLVRPGVDTEAFSPGPDKRKGLGFGADEFVILFVGWFLPRKGIDFLLYAVRDLLRSTRTRIRLVMVGSGPGRERTETLAQRLEIRDACTFAGSVPYSKMPEYFRSADCFVLPSIATPEWQEQFGMSLIEAMSCGLPVIGTYSGAIPEVIGESGLLCQPNDFVSLASALERLMDDQVLRHDAGIAGRDRVEREFGLQRFAEQMSAVYSSLA